MQKISSMNVPLRLHYKETGIVWKLSNYFLTHIPFHTKKIIFLFIGTDRSTGDAFGPLPGSHLTERKLFPHQVIGTLADPLHALNLEEKLQEIEKENPDAFLVAIDACLGRVSSIGHFIIHDEPLYPGQAVGKNLPAVGNISIKAIVNISGFMEHAVLQSTRLHLPYEMSKILARALQLAYSRSHSNKMNQAYNDANDDYAWH